MCELLLADYTRRGFLDGVGIRLPTSLRAARQAEQGGVGLLLRHHPRAARRPGGGAARPGNDAHAREPALGRRVSDPCGRLTRERLEPRVNLTMPGVLHGRRTNRSVAPCRGRQGRRADPPEPDELIQQIVAGLAEPLRGQARACARISGARIRFEDIIPNPQPPDPTWEVPRGESTRAGGERDRRQTARRGLPAKAGAGGECLDMLVRRGPRAYRQRIQGGL